MNDENAPGTCVDCGADAYIRLATDDAFICAHCFAGRAAQRRVPSAPAVSPEMPVEHAG